MALQPINRGAAVNDPAAENLYTAFGKLNEMLAEVYAGTHRAGQRFTDLRGGSIASPSATITDSAGFFTLPGGNIIIPANTMVPGKTLVEIDGMFVRRQVSDSTPQQVNIKVILSTAPAFSSPQFMASLPLTAVANRQASLKTRLMLNTGRLTRDENNPATANTGIFFDSSGSFIDHTQPMQLAFYSEASKAGSAAGLGDIIDLVYCACRVTVGS